jgi:hypothetical protein
VVICSVVPVHWESVAAFIRTSRSTTFTDTAVLF